MALKRFDSFSHYTTFASLLKKWPYSAGTPAFEPTGGRGGSGRIITYNAGSIADIFANHATWITGAYYTSQNATRWCNIAMFSDAATIQCSCYIDPDGYIKVYRGDLNGTLLGTSSSPAYLPGSSHYFEFKATIHGSAGSYEVRSDGIPILTGSSKNTQASANAYANKIAVPNHISISSCALYVQDLYICDGSGSAPCNNFLGDCKAIAYLPTGNGTTSNFVGSDTNSTDNYLLVDEATPNTTDYIDSLTPNDIDLVNVANIADTPSIIYGVQTNLYACKSDAGAVRTVADVIRSGGVNYPGTSKTLGTDWVYLTEVYENNPNTGAAWTKDNFNSAEFGVKMVS